jgi:predicted acetyltransferase
MSEIIKMRKCTNCKETLPIEENFYRDRYRKSGYRYICKKCSLAVSRKQTHRAIWNKNHRESINKSVSDYLERNPEKKKAYKIWRSALASGKVVRKPCIFCGNTASQGHHQDYSKPLEVVWLCRTHHMDVHHKRIIL